MKQSLDVVKEELEEAWKNVYESYKKKDFDEFKRYTWHKEKIDEEEQRGEFLTICEQMEEFLEPDLEKLNFHSIINDEKYAGYVIFKEEDKGIFDINMECFIKINEKWKLAPKAYATTIKGKENIDKKIKEFFEAYKRLFS